MRSTLCARWGGLLIFLGLLGSHRLAAQVVVLTSPAQFTTTTTLVDFETFPDTTQVPYTSSNLSNQWASLGVTISDDSPADGVSAYSSTYSVSPHSGSRAIADSVNSAGGYIDFTFVLPDTTTPTTVTEAGLWVLNGDQASTVTFYAANGSVLSSWSPAAGTTFAGLQAPAGIARIRVSDPDYYLVDDLQFTSLTAAVPEPSALMLLSLSLGLLALAPVHDRLRRLRG
jgi:hypothetical protein